MSEVGRGEKLKSEGKILGISVYMRARMSCLTYSRYIIAFRAIILVR